MRKRVPFSLEEDLLRLPFEGDCLEEVALFSHVVLDEGDAPVAVGSTDAVDGPTAVSRLSEHDLLGGLQRDRHQASHRGIHHDVPLEAVVEFSVFRSWHGFLSAGSDQK